MHEWSKKANTWVDDCMKEWLNMQVDKETYQGVFESGHWIEPADIQYIANQVARGNCQATCDDNNHTTAVVITQKHTAG